MAQDCVIRSKQQKRNEIPIFTYVLVYENCFSDIEYFIITQANF